MYKSLLNIIMLGYLFLGITNCKNTKPSFNDIPVVNIQFCDTCKFKDSVLEFEQIISSDLLIISDFEILDFVGNKLISSRIGVPTKVNLFRRRSTVHPFDEYVVYYFSRNINIRPRTNTLFNDGEIIEFNCGTEPFGYDTTKANIKYFWTGRYPGLTPVRNIPLDTFKIGYYSIVKWLYAQETDRYKVKRKVYEQFDFDYYSRPSIIQKDLVLEDSWQEEFLFT